MVKKEKNVLKKEFAVSQILFLLITFNFINMLIMQKLKVKLLTWLQQISKYMKAIFYMEYLNKINQKLRTY